MTSAIAHLRTHPIGHLLAACAGAGLAYLLRSLGA